jgi:RNA polymerase sigma-70 factor (ECF subfamily)
VSRRADDDLLIARAQKGDREALNELISRYEAKAYQYAFRLTRDPDKAAELASDAFYRICTSLKSFRGQSAFTTWLYRIVTNCFLDRRKRDKSDRNVSIDAPGPGGSERQFEDESDTPDLHAERSARESAMQEALAKLPDYQQSMMVMYHVEMLSYEEIARVLDLPLGTVKSRLNRARAALRDHLSGCMELFNV